MVRLGLLALPLLAACTGEIQSDNLVGLPPEEQVAQTRWVENALPIFASERTKCMTCHDGSMPMAPAYLAGDDDLAKRETLVAFVPRVVNLLAAQSSRMLTVGDHTALGGGPALLAPEASSILEWIKVEKLARPQPDPIRTAQATLQVCTSGAPGDPTCPLNTIDLSGIGPTPVAATFEFTVSQIGADSYFTNMKIKAGAEGVYLEHPLIESYPGGMVTPDPIDRFFAVVINLQPNTEIALGPNGTTSIAGFSVGDPISLQFDVIEKARPAQ